MTTKETRAALDTVEKSDKWIKRLQIITLFIVVISAICSSIFFGMKIENAVHDARSASNNTHKQQTADIKELIDDGNKRDELILCLFTLETGGVEGLPVSKRKECQRTANDLGFGSSFDTVLNEAAGSVRSLAGGNGNGVRNGGTNGNSGGGQTPDQRREIEKILDSVTNPLLDLNLPPRQ